MTSTVKGLSKLNQAYNSNNSISTTKSFTWFSATLTTVDFLLQAALQAALQANAEIQMERMNWGMVNTSNIPVNRNIYKTFNMPIYVSSSRITSNQLVIDYCIFHEHAYFSHKAIIWNMEYRIWIVHRYYGLLLWYTFKCLVHTGLESHKGE